VIEQLSPREASAQEITFSLEHQSNSAKDRRISADQIIRICQLSYTQLCILQHYIQMEHENMVIPDAQLDIPSDSQWLAVADERVLNIF
jgi:hypothetical protein